MNKKTKKTYRTLSEFEEAFLRDNPDEIDEYLEIVFEEYYQDGDIGALLSSLRVIGRVKGVSNIAETTGMSRKGIQKALSETGNPYFETVSSIVKAMGYALVPQRV